MKTSAHTQHPNQPKPKNRPDPLPPFLKPMASLSSARSPRSQPSANTTRPSFPPPVLSLRGARPSAAGHPSARASPAHARAQAHAPATQPRAAPRAQPESPTPRAFRPLTSGARLSAPSSPPQPRRATTPLNPPRSPASFPLGHASPGSPPAFNWPLRTPRALTLHAKCRHQP